MGNLTNTDFVLKIFPEDSMTKQQDSKKRTFLLSTWGHLGLSGLIGEWETRLANKYPAQGGQTVRRPAPLKKPKPVDPA